MAAKISVAKKALKLGLERLLKQSRSLRKQNSKRLVDQICSDLEKLQPLLNRLSSRLTKREKNELDKLVIQISGIVRR